MSARTDFAASLRAAPSLPSKSYDVKDVPDLPDAIRKATIVIQSDGYVPAPNAAGNWIAKFKVVLARPETDIDKAETGLDLDLPNLLEALQKYLGMTWSTADPVTVKSLYRGYSVACSLPIARPF